MAVSDMSQPERSGFAKILRNLGWLLGGKGFAAVCSLAYLAILARSLEVKDFGHFALILATGQLLCALATFETWQTVVRFGAEPVRASDWDAFGRLAWLCASLDMFGAVLGCAIAALVFYGFGNALEINPAYTDMGFAFACVLLWSRMTTPTGIVRVLDRFDIGTYVEAVLPAGRLIASLLILWIGPSVGLFLLAWATLDLLGGTLYWFAAYRLAPQSLTHRNLVNPIRVIRQEKNLRRFFAITYGSTTLDALTRQGPVLAVGYFLGTSAAGLYRLADQLALGVARVANMVARAALPEFVLAGVRTDAASSSAMVKQVTTLASAGGVTVVLLALTVGDEIMMLMGGEAFLQAADVLVPVAIAASLGLAAVAFEPLLYSTAYARYPLIVRLIGAAMLSSALIFFAPHGLMPLAWSVAGSAAIVSILMALAARHALTNLRSQRSS